MTIPSNLEVTTPAITPDDLADCPIRNVIARFGDAWSFVVMLTLADEAMRFMALQRALPGVSQRVLTHTLRQLERDGFISRTVVPTVPISVSYALTTLGQSFIEPARHSLRWANKANPRVNAARQRYDATTKNG